MDFWYNKMDPPESTTCLMLTNTYWTSTMYQALCQMMTWRRACMANHSGHTQLKQLSTHVKWWHNTVFRLQRSKQTDSSRDLHTEMEAFQVWRAWKGQILPWGSCIWAGQTQTWPEIPGEPLRQTRGTNASAMGTLKRQDIFKAISVISLGEAWDGVYTILAS